MPEPKVRPDVRLSSYDVIIDQGAIAKLNRLIDAGPFEVHVAHLSAGPSRRGAPGAG